MVRSESRFYSLEKSQDPGFPLLRYPDAITESEGSESKLSNPSTPKSFCFSPAHA